MPAFAVRGVAGTRGDSRRKTPGRKRQVHAEERQRRKSVSVVRGGESLPVARDQSPLADRVKHNRSVEAPGVFHIVYVFCSIRCRPLPLTAEEKRKPPHA